MKIALVTEKTDVTGHKVYIELDCEGYKRQKYEKYIDNGVVKVSRSYCFDGLNLSEIFELTHIFIMRKNKMVFGIPLIVSQTIETHSETVIINDLDIRISGQREGEILENWSYLSESINKVRK